MQQIRDELQQKEQEQRRLQQAQKYNDPKELRHIVSQVLLRLVQRILAYLDGSIDVAMKFPESLQTLEDEIVEEEESDWVNREINHFTEQEEWWRDRICDMEEMPEQVQPEGQFIGGKQYQRALGFFHACMIDHLPEPHGLRKYVSNTTGYLSGGLQRENWERAMVEITKLCVKEVTHPGINYFVKHVGVIFRRLFPLALEDLKRGEEFSRTFQLLPSRVEAFLVEKFDDMLWKLLVGVASKTHTALEPMYSTIDPNLPTFVTNYEKKEADRQETYTYNEDTESYDKVESARDKEREGYFASFKNKMLALVTGSGAEAKNYLRQESRQRAMQRKTFLPDKRTSMITKDETTEILQRSFEYITALMEFNLVNLKFQFNHYLYEGFKQELQVCFGSKLLNDTNWESLVEQDSSAQQLAERLEEQIKGLRESVRLVATLQNRMR